MHSYQHHISDFNNATRHLDRLERSIYRDLIELYYSTEFPLSLDIAFLCRKIIARTEQEITAVQQVLNEFFTETEHGWAHNRCEHEIEKYRSNTTAKAMAGKASAEARKQKRIARSMKPSTAVEHELYECDTEDQQNSTNQKPETINQELIKHNVIDPTDRDRVPVEDVINLFNRSFDTLPEVKVFSDKRKTAVRRRWKENPQLQTLESWEHFFNWVKQSNFLMGRTDKPWTGFCFDWLFNPTNFAKIIEGNYHRGQI